MGDVVCALLLSLGLTEVFEGVFAVCVGKRCKALLPVALVNLVTNPTVVLVHQLWGGGWLLTACLELAAVAVEGMLYRYSGLFQKPFWFSLAANALSFSLGLLINQLV